MTDVVDHDRRLCNVFFFQAEDGIRDRNVTGVQTCALPIFEGADRVRDLYQHLRAAGDQLAGAVEGEVGEDGAAGAGRSEERRVGKSVDVGGGGIIKRDKRREMKAEY